MDFDLPGEVKLFKEIARRFVDEELAPREAEFRPQGTEKMPRQMLGALQGKAQDLGLWLLGVPEEYGGAGLGLLARCVIVEEMAHSILFPVRQNELFGPIVQPALFHCNQEQKDRFLLPVIRGEMRICLARTEPDAGNDLAAVVTTATREGEDFLISGTKRFVTGAGLADYAQVLASTDLNKGANGLACFLVDLKSAGVSLGRQWPTVMGDDPWEIRFEKVRVPAINMLGKVGEGLSLGQKGITEEGIQNQGARPVGIAQAALNMMTEYAQHRETFGLPLSERQAIQFMVADSALELQAARLMVHHCAWKYDRGENVTDLASMVKLLCTEMATRVVDRSMQVHGGVGLSIDLPLEWWFRQLRGLRVTDGASEVLRWNLARSIMKGRQTSS